MRCPLIIQKRPYRRCPNRLVAVIWARAVFQTPSLFPFRKRFARAPTETEIKLEGPGTSGIVVLGHRIRIEGPGWPGMMSLYTTSPSKVLLTNVVGKFHIGIPEFYDFYRDRRSLGSCWFCIIENNYLPRYRARALEILDKVRYGFRIF